MANRTVKLIMVDSSNHNKFYNMSDLGDGKITVLRGRVGVTEIPESHPIHKWDALLKSKIKKGYKDVTHLFSEAVSGGPSKVDFLDISDKFISSLISKLESYTQKQVSTNYRVTADSVTEKQIKEAQDILNTIASVKSNRELNKYLLEVFSVIPRKMKHVQDHLYSESDDFKTSIIEKVIAEEQELLDSMAQQVKQVELVAENTNDKLTLLDAMGIEIYNVDSVHESLMKSKLQNLKDNYIRGFKVVNKKTQAKFEARLKNRENKKVELFWHGSRNENILPILNSGLLIRPTGAIHTGSMYSDGIYGADKAQKSFGYTSARGSYWARGSAPEAYMALFNFHVGKQLEVKRHESWCYKINEKFLQDKGGYDSIFALGGYDLRNNEFVVYSPDAVTIEYLVQLKG